MLNRGLSDGQQAGVTLLELLIAMTVSASLLMMAVPSFSDWLANARVRASTESMLAGVQLARAEAIKRNAYVRFQLTSTTSNACALSSTGSNWVVSLDNPAGACGSAPSDTGAPRIIQIRPGNEGTAAVTVAATSASSAANLIRFNGLGQLVAPSAGFNMQMSLPAAGACQTAGGDLRCLQVRVSPSGQARMCDPARSSPDPEGC